MPILMTAKNLNRSVPLIKRRKERQANDVIHMKMRQQQENRRIAGRVTFFLQALPEITEARPRIENNPSITGTHLNAGGVASIAENPIVTAGAASPDTPKGNSQIVLFRTSGSATFGFAW